MLQRIISLLIGYACGLCLGGGIMSRVRGVDVTKYGSHNVGTTNTIRVLGLPSGIVTFLIDVFKSVIAALLVWLIFKGGSPDDVRLLMVYGSFGAVLGHDFPFYKKFRGGKGIATSFGLLIACFPLTIPVCAAVFVIAVAVTRFISLGSILACAAFAVQALIFAPLGLLPFTGTALYEAVILSCLVGIIGIAKHHANIGRLIHGTENRFTFRPKNTVTGPDKSSKERSK